MADTIPADAYCEDRKAFYDDFMEFTRRYPNAKVGLYVPQRDLPLLAREEWSSITRNLLDLCDSGRLRFTGGLLKPQLIEYLHRVRSFTAY